MQIGLSCTEAKHELLEMRRIAAYITKKAEALLANKERIPQTKLYSVLFNCILPAKRRHTFIIYHKPTSLSNQKSPIARSYVVC